ncbi:hypothetical protein [Ruminococcus flavefaciens]|uniref:hypothetical protein n=1 Tax=Ruminococcus flavefaciens TaxID=1265 RepID=UPI00048E1ED5|nr:hypothetical protein [Ruminococcus flavefaciens]
MKIRELIRYSGRLLEGRRARTMMICLLPLGAELFFRFAEAAVFSLLLYFGGSMPIELFSGSSAVQLSVTGVCTLLRWLTAAPLMYGAAQRLYLITAELPHRRTAPFSRTVLNKRTLRRSISAALWTRAIGLLGLVPLIFFGAWGYELLRGRLRGTGLFLAANAVFLGVVSAVLWLSLKLSFAAVPFLLARYPQLTAFRVVMRSVGFMRGRKRVLLGLLAVYLPQMLTIAGLPYALMRLMTAFSLSIDIFIREDEYLETDRADGGQRKARDAGKISRKKRRVKAAADKA